MDQKLDDLKKEMPISNRELNIEIVKNGKNIAIAYYPWSASTRSALFLCHGIIEQYQKNKVHPDETCDTEIFFDNLNRAWARYEYLAENAPKVTRVKIEGQYDKKDEDLLLATRLLESTGAGIDKLELTRICNKGVCKGITFRTAIDKNFGLIAVTEQGINEVRRPQGKIVTIDLDHNRIYFNVFRTSDIEEYLEEYEIDSQTDHVLLPVTANNGIDIKNFRFEDIDAVFDTVSSTETTNIMLDNKTVCIWII